jgi:uncharacterized small protein (DUF1192 family)
MDTDDVARPPLAPLPPKIEELSIDDLRARIAALQAEIADTHAMIAAKESLRGEAEGLFRTE